MNSSDHDSSNSAEDLSLPFRNNLSFAPSSSPESLYNNRNDPNSFVNSPSCNWNSSRCSTLPNFYPGDYIGSSINQNVRCHSHQLPFGPFTRIDLRRRETRNFHLDNRAGSPGIKEKRFAKVNHNRNVNMRGSLFGPSIETDLRRRETDNFHPNNRASPSCIKEKRFVSDVNRYRNAKMRHNPCSTYDDKTNLKPNPERKRQKKFKCAKNEHAIVSSGYQNGPILDHFSNEHEGRCTDFYFGDEVTNEIVNNFNNEYKDIPKDFYFGDEVTNVIVNSFESKTIIELPNCQASHITIPEKTVFNVQDSQQENSEDTGSAIIEFYTPVFEGKDENGEDIVISIGSPGTDAVEIMKKTDLCRFTQNLETRDNQATMNSVIENTSLISETFSAVPVQEGSSEVHGSKALLPCHDCCAEET